MKGVPGNCGLPSFEDSSILVDSGGPKAGPGLGLAEESLCLQEWQHFRTPAVESPQPGL